MFSNQLAQQLNECPLDDATACQLFELLKSIGSQDWFVWIKRNVPEHFLRHEQPAALFVNLLRLIADHSNGSNRSLSSRFVPVLTDVWYLVTHHQWAVAHPNVDPPSFTQEQYDVLKTHVYPKLPGTLWSRLILALKIPMTQPELFKLVKDAIAARRMKDAAVIATTLDITHLFSLEEVCTPLLQSGQHESAFAFVRRQAQFLSNLEKGSCSNDSALSALSSQSLSASSSTPIPSSELQRQSSNELLHSFIHLMMKIGIDSKIVMKYVRSAGLDPLAFPLLLLTIRAKVMNWLYHEGKLLDYAPFMLPGDKPLQTMCVSKLASHEEWVMLRRLCSMPVYPIVEIPIVQPDGSSFNGFSSSNSDFGSSNFELNAMGVRVAPVIERNIISEDMWQRVMHSDEVNQLELQYIEKEEMQDELDAQTYFQAEAADGALMVDSPGTLAQFRDAMQSTDLIGLDSEFEPTCLDVLSASSLSIPALLQVSTRQVSYLVDVMTIRKDIELLRELAQILTEVFENPRVLKVGYAFKEDMKVLRRVFPFDEYLQHVTSYFELSLFQDILFAQNIQSYDASMLGANPPLFVFNLSLRPPVGSTSAVVDSETVVTPSKKNLKKDRWRNRNRKSKSKAALSSSVIDSSVDQENDADNCETKQEAAQPSSSSPVVAESEEASILQSPSLENEISVSIDAESNSATSFPELQSPSAQATTGDAKRGGLKRLVEIMLGKPLNKQCQMSNWCLRPLSVKQLKYAALDAFCEILLLDRANAMLPSMSAAQKKLEDFVVDL